MDARKDLSSPLESNGGFQSHESHEGALEHVRWLLSWVGRGGHKEDDVSMCLNVDIIVYIYIYII